MSRKPIENEILELFFHWFGFFAETFCSLIPVEVFYGRRALHCVTSTSRVEPTHMHAELSESVAFGEEH